MLVVTPSLGWDHGTGSDEFKPRKTGFHSHSLLTEQHTSREFPTRKTSGVFRSRKKKKNGTVDKIFNPCLPPLVPVHPAGRVIILAPTELCTVAVLRSAGFVVLVQRGSISQ
ncbi:unnamed protein product [Pleuronectes platessa]|uniref:Uncharacterized protein n=1 Tax=Pleuronectes platessa TaxID=8262 RepID=A0A9N7Z3Q2_PLEPL|nr:unnamed protein product [Pleuronectes platessa]